MSGSFPCFSEVIAAESFTYNECLGTPWEDTNIGLLSCINGGFTAGHRFGFAKLMGLE